MTLTYRPTQEQDPQEPGSQHNHGAGPRDGMDQQTAPPGSPPRIAEPIRRRVVVRPPVTPPSGDRFFSQGNNGQNLSANNQKQAIEQLPTGALPAPSSLSSNRAQTIEQLRTAALSVPPAPASNRQQAVEPPRASVLPGTLHTGNAGYEGNSGNGAAKTREPGPLRNAPGAGFMAYTASPAEMAQQRRAQGARPKPEVENGNILLYRTHNFFLRTVYRPGQRQNPLRKPTGHTSVMPRIMPDQEKRMAASETRMMPSVTVNTTKQTRAIPLPAWAEAIMVDIALMGVLVDHAYNT